MLKQQSHFPEQIERDVYDWNTTFLEISVGSGMKNQESFERVHKRLLALKGNRPLPNFGSLIPDFYQQLESFDYELASPVMRQKLLASWEELSEALLARADSLEKQYPVLRHTRILLCNPERYGRIPHNDE